MDSPLWAGVVRVVAVLIPIGITLWLAAMAFTREISEPRFAF